VLQSAANVTAGIVIDIAKRATGVFVGKIRSSGFCCVGTKTPCVLLVCSRLQIAAVHFDLRFLFEQESKMFILLVQLKVVFFCAKIKALP
jgi:hypothetical protein